MAAICFGGTLSRLHCSCVVFTSTGHPLPPTVFFPTLLKNANARQALHNYLASNQSLSSALATNQQGGPFSEIATNSINWTSRSDSPLREMNACNLCYQVPQHIALTFHLSISHYERKKKKMFSAVIYCHSQSLNDSFVVTLFKASLEKSQHLGGISAMLIQNKNQCCYSMNESFANGKIYPSYHSEATSAV